ncbi:MAG TPA: maleylpyruvate isomerase family mycothiol-dependent enzyme [Mycobacteriales bacterium]|nr:maleylpyruvate isomerase family mycothiol-dependent enzyme [Mycobacteriales bacterium]
MTRIMQFYGGAVVPMRVPSDPEQVESAWQTHRGRLREWLGDLSASEWSTPTRCSAWDVTGLVQHLISGAQFLGYTLHLAGKGEASRLLQGFDPQQTPAATADQFRGLSREELLGRLADMDTRVEQECHALAGGGWDALAEAPAGNVPAFMALNHFLFDSWVHERDLLLPRGEDPTADEAEAAAVTSYVLALACVAREEGMSNGPPVAFDVHITDLDRTVHVESTDDGSAAATFTRTATTPQVSGRAGDLVDFVTGRQPEEAPVGEPDALSRLHRLAELMA